MKASEEYTGPDADLAVFVRQVRARSAENSAAVTLLHGRGLVGSLVSTLRQELDSLVRVVYLLSLRDPERRGSLVRSAVHGDRWPVRDREMVELTDRLNGWTRSVYAFGCGFIHLSRSHDHAERDPFTALPSQERSDILAHMRHYHGGPMSESPAFEELVPYLPRVFAKIRDNLECYIQMLEAHRHIDD